jgi:hypothetical protein
MAEKGRLLTGARARFSIGGVKVGYARNVTLGERVDYEEARVLDNIEVEEHAPVAYDVNFTASQFRIVGETVKSLGWFPSAGKSPQEHLENILNMDVLTATVEDNKTGKILATVEQVKMTNRNYTIDARGLVGEDVEFVAIRVKDESEV